MWRQARRHRRGAREDGVRVPVAAAAVAVATQRGVGVVQHVVGGCCGGGTDAGSRAVGGRRRGGVVTAAVVRARAVGILTAAAVVPAREGEGLVQWEDMTRLGVNTSA